jgi:hypothetical protein
VRGGEGDVPRKTFRLAHFLAGEQILFRPDVIRPLLMVAFLEVLMHSSVQAEPERAALQNRKVNFLFFGHGVTYRVVAIQALAASIAETFGRAAFSSAEAVATACIAAVTLRCACLVASIAASLASAALRTASNRFLVGGSSTAMASGAGITKWENLSNNSSERAMAWFPPERVAAMTSADMPVGFHSQFERLRIRR